MALDKFRRIDMQINRANDYQIETQFVKEGDYNGRELVVQITNAGEVSDQTGVSLNFGWRHDSVGNTGLDPFSVVDASKGIFKITYPTEMLIAGDVTASIQVIENGTITFTRNFNIIVEHSPIDEDAIVSENSFTVLQEALKTVSQYDSRIANIEDGIGNVETKIENFKTVNVLDFGAVGDGITDDTAKIQSLSDTLDDGDTLIFPNGVYRTTDTITIKKSIKIKMQGYILADHANVGVLFKNSDAEGNFSARSTNKKSTLDIEIDLLRAKNKDYETLSSCVGVEVWNAFYATFNIKRIENNNIGLKLIGQKYGTGYAATTYCKFYLGVITSHYTNILLEATGPTGWVTQNQFYSGSLGGENIEGTIHVNLNNPGTSSMDENTFFGTSFEGGYRTAIKGLNAMSNRFISCRFEMPYMNFLFDFQNSRFNQILNGYGVSGSMRKMAYNNNNESVTTKENYVNFIDYKLGYVEFFDDIYYIKPLSNKSGKYYPINNGLADSLIPEGWRVETLKNGLTDGFMQVSESNVVDNKISFRVDLVDKQMISESSTYTANELVFTKPPKHSKEGYLFFLNGLYPNLKLSVNSDFAGIQDKTGNNSTIPTGKSMVKYLYEYFTNRIYILEYY